MADDVDPFEREAFKKASRGLVSAALRLVGSELAFLTILVPFACIFFSLERLPRMDQIALMLTFVSSGAPSWH